MTDTEKTPNPSITTIPIFPLPTSVFFPNTPLPLNIFEPRYRYMVAEALEGEKQIGMVLLKPGWEDSYYGNPEIDSTGCVGKISRHILLPDGKYNILLEGLSRFRILNEIEGKIYRRAEVKLLPDINDEVLSSSNTPMKDELIRQYETYMGLLPEGNPFKEPIDVTTCQTLGQLVDNIAYNFDLPVEEKQVLLEESNVARRVDAIHTIIKMKTNIIHLSKANSRNKVDVRMN